MRDGINTAISLIESLNERAKELNCLYVADDILKDLESDSDVIFTKFVNALPPGWQFPAICEARLRYKDQVYKTLNYKETSNSLNSEITVDSEKVGELQVVYVEEVPEFDDGPFLKEERNLIDALTEKISFYIFRKKLKEIFGAQKKLEKLERHDAKLIRLIASSNSEKIREYLESPGPDVKSVEKLEEILEPRSDEHWKFRKRYAELIARKAGARKRALERFGVERFYLIGSAKNATSGPASDLDLIVLFVGDAGRRELLETWLEGWSLCLSEINLALTGYETDGLLDVHFVTREDVKNKTSFAAKIGSPTDAALSLKFEDE